MMSLAMKLEFINLNLLGKLAIKYGPLKTAKKTVIAKRTLSAKKVLYAQFFFGEGVARQVPVERGKS